MALPSKLGPNGSDIGGLVGSITSYGVNADAVVQEGFFGAAPASSVSMALSAIEGADLCSAAMDLVAVPVNMSLSATEGADIASATMSLAVAMSLAAIEGADTASGAVALVQSMALTATEGADLASAGVSLVQSMSLAAVEGADLCVASMDVVTASIDMTLDATEGADTCSAAMDIVVPEVVTPPSYTSTAGGGATVPVTDDNLGVWIEDEETIVPATPLPKLASAPKRASIYQETADLSLILGPHPAPVEVLQVAKKLQAAAGPTPAEVLKAKHNHALRLLLLAS